MWIFGCGSVALAAILDSLFRARVSGFGYKWTLLEGGAFDYRKYHQERKQRGWSAWPVYLMWAAAILGIALLIAAFFALFETVPTHPN
jgi:hypothetical protein